MTNKEISAVSSNLDEIKRKYMDYEYDYNLKKTDINWLIKQAERVQELEESIERWQSGRKIAVSTKIKIDELETQNKRYREALETIEMVTEFKSEANEIANKALEGEGWKQ